MEMLQCNFCGKKTARANAVEFVDYRDFITCGDLRCDEQAVTNLGRRYKTDSKKLDVTTPYPKNMRDAGPPIAKTHRLQPISGLPTIHDPDT